VFQKLWLRKKRKVKIKRGDEGFIPIYTPPPHTIHHFTTLQTNKELIACENVSSVL